MLAGNLWGVGVAEEFDSRVIFEVVDEPFVAGEEDVYFIGATDELAGGFLDGGV